MKFTVSRLIFVCKSHGNGRITIRMCVIHNILYQNTRRARWQFGKKICIFIRSCVYISLLVIIVATKSSKKSFCYFFQLFRGVCFANKTTVSLYIVKHAVSPYFLLFFSWRHKKKKEKKYYKLTTLLKLFTHSQRPNNISEINRPKPFPTRFVVRTCRTS